MFTLTQYANFLLAVLAAVNDLKDIQIFTHRTRHYFRYNHAVYFKHPVNGSFARVK